jgi:hypothetical protein
MSGGRRQDAKGAKVARRTRKKTKKRKREKEKKRKREKENF